MKPPIVEQQSWRQVSGVDRWELKRADAVLATVWLEGGFGFWHWSVPGSIPRRGGQRLFRDAVRQAEAASKENA